VGGVATRERVLQTLVLAHALQQLRCEVGMKRAEGFKGKNGVVCAARHRGHKITAGGKRGPACGRVVGGLKGETLQGLR